MNNKKQKFTLGFIFNKSLDKVLLLKKNIIDTERTKELKLLLHGRLNGLGGLIEPNESPLECIRREVKEESGLKINNWINFCNLDAKFGYVYCFYAVTDEIYNFQTLEDEEVNIYSLNQIKFLNNDWSADGIWYKHLKRMANLDWLIPQAINNYKNLDSCKLFEIREVYGEE